MSNASLIYLLYYCMKVYGFCCMILFSHKTGYMELFYINDQILDLWPMLRKFGSSFYKLLTLISKYTCACVLTRRNFRNFCNAVHVILNNEKSSCNKKINFTSLRYLQHLLSMPIKSYLITWDNIIAMNLVKPFT